jgi:hypothetical protein
MTGDEDGGTVIHAYGIVPGGECVALPETGIGGAGVALLDGGSVAAVFSRLCSASYGDAAWHAHAEDATWLTEVATGHHAVLGRIIEDTDVLPLRLPAMYRDEAHLHAMLLTESRLFEAALAAVHDHVEWGVKIFFTGAPASAPPPRPTSGREFLMQRSNAAAERENARVRRRVRVQDAYAALADVARHSTTSAPQDPAISGRPEPMLLNSAHLVCRRHRDLFFTAVSEVTERLASAGLVVEVSGPWPPYSFVDLGADRLEV